MSGARALLVAVTVGLTARPVLDRALLVKFRRDVRRLNGGDYSTLLASYADDAELVFHDGPHRWSGPDHGRYQGRAAIEGFLRTYVAAGVQGELRRLWTSGPPWALTILARFDDHADGADHVDGFHGDGDDGALGEEDGRRYENQTVLVLKTRGTRIVHHQDFYVDTQRIVDFDRVLSEQDARVTRGA